jgi:hypothetical protein
MPNAIRSRSCVTKHVKQAALQRSRIAGCWRRLERMRQARKTAPNVHDTSRRWGEDGVPAQVTNGLLPLIGRLELLSTHLVLVTLGWRLAVRSPVQLHGGNGLRLVRLSRLVCPPPLALLFSFIELRSLVVHSEFLRMCDLPKALQKQTVVGVGRSIFHFFTRP